MSKKGVEKRHSETAIFAALYRAIANKEFKNEGFGSDYLAEYLLPSHFKFFIKFKKIRVNVKNKSNKLTPGMYEYMLARTAFFDNVFIDALNKNIPQIVLLGAGYDTRAYRFAKLNNTTKIIELDIATTQNRKKKCLKKAQIDIPKHVTLVPLPSDAPGSTVDIEDKAFALYKSAQGNKRQGRFQGAEENLKKSLALLSKNSSYYDDINEELHYHLPLAKARWHIEHHQIKELEATIQSLEGYIENHSKRFAYMKTIDELYTSLHYLERALEHNVRARLRNIEIILQNEFAENGEYPKSQEDFARLVARFLSNDLALRSYKTNRDGYEAVFWDNKREVLVKIPSGQN